MAGFLDGTGFGGLGLGGFDLSNFLGMDGNSFGTMDYSPLGDNSISSNPFSATDTSATTNLTAGNNTASQSILDNINKPINTGAQVGGAESGLGGSFFGKDSSTFDNFTKLASAGLQADAYFQNRAKNKAAFKRDSDAYNNKQRGEEGARNAFYNDDWSGTNTTKRVDTDY